MNPVRELHVLVHPSSRFCGSRLCFGACPYTCCFPHSASEQREILEQRPKNDQFVQRANLLFDQGRGRWYVAGNLGVSNVTYDDTSRFACALYMDRSHAPCHLSAAEARAAFRLRYASILAASSRERSCSTGTVILSRAAAAYFALRRPSSE